METNTKALAVKMAVDGWNMQLDRTTQLIDGLTDEQLATDTAPGRNSGKYLVGHLAAVSDRLIDMLGGGNRLHPELDEPFLFKPDKSGLPTPTIPELRQYWTDIHAKLQGHILAMTPDEWFGRHSAVTEEEFQKEPHRNKLNVLMGRAVHMSNHLGQLSYLKPRKVSE